MPSDCFRGCAISPGAPGRVWFDKEEMKGGQTVSEQIDRAIQVNDRLLVVLSEASMHSHWVKYSYFIPDFSNWQDHDAFESAFVRLLKDLRAESVVKG